MIWKVSPKIPQNKRKQYADFDDITAQLLFNRNIELTAVNRFFDNKLEGLHNAESLANIQAATDFIIKAVEDKRKIYIYGDYDVDGVCSSAIVFDFLYRQLGANVIPYIPSRFEEGYGMNTKALQSIKDDGGEVIITVDCGIRDGRLVKDFSDKLDFIITDHHDLPEDNKDMELLIKNAKAVIHPGLSEDYSFKSICAATVAWKFVSVLSKKAYSKGIIEERFDTNVYLDLAALATVCDIMPLVDENRIILKHGIEQMRKTVNLGLRELLTVSGVISEEIEPYHLGYVIGPRLNAAGRIKDALDAVRLLTSHDQAVVREKARQMSDLNSQRQIITKKLLEEAEKELISWGLDKKLIFITGEEWPEGVVGLVAGRLCEKYHKPVLVGSKVNGRVVGSARSIKSFNITQAISKSTDLLLRFGGHAQAAGFTLEEENLERFANSILAEAESKISQKDLERILHIDLELSLDQLSFDTINIFEKFAPFGFGNKQPIVIVESMILKSKKTVGSTGDHVKLNFEVGGKDIEGIAFGKAEEFKNYNNGDFLDVAGYIEENKFLGKSTLQLKIQDMRNAKRL